MNRLLICVFLVVHLAVPASALDIQAPLVPDSASDWMPEDTDSLGAGLGELFRRGLEAIRPDLKEAAGTSLSVIAAALVVSLLRSFSGTVTRAADTAGAAAVAALLLRSTNSLVRLGADTVTEISEYGKLLLPVMTTAMAAQGGITGSAALYAGTALFNAVLTGVIRKLLVPGIWLYLALSTANSATGEEMLKKQADFLKGSVNWVLKTLLMAFTTYLGLTGVVSGTTDAAALKAAKVTISSVVPVVGGVLSDASEAVLVSAGLLKNAAGIYGILAVLAVFLEPFLKIGCHYLVLKLTAAVCAMFCGKGMAGLTGNFCTAMGLLLAMTGAGCVMMLVSTVCFLRGVG